jgi:PilZ domain
MSDRRRQYRNRVYYSGTIAFNDRKSTVACVVRNFNSFGAMVEFENPAIVPDWVDFEVQRKGVTYLAHLAWRDRDRAGLVFSASPKTNDVIPIEWARKLRASEQVNKALQARIDQLRSEH